MADQTGPSSAGNPVDPITAFWRDVMARSAAAMPNMPGMPNIPGMAGFPNPMAGMAAGMPGAMPGAIPGVDPAAAAAFFSPDVLRRMQGAFFDAMAQHAEQYMRSPQFLEAMKRSMDQALQFKRQMDDFLKSNMSNAFETVTGGANTEILGAIRQTSAQLQAHLDARMDRLEARVARLESGSDPDTSASTGAKPAAAKKSK